MTTAALLIAAALAILANRWSPAAPHHESTGYIDEITNLVLILITIAGAVAAMLAQREGGEIAARFVAGVRALGTAAIALPAAAAGILVYDGIVRSTSSHISPGTWLWVIAGLAITVAVAIWFAWLCSFLADRNDVLEESPWDMTNHNDRNRSSVTWDYQAARAEYGFDKPAVGIRSAEGWHTRYAWSDADQGLAIDRIRSRKWSTQRGSSIKCSLFDTRCATRHQCSRLRMLGDRPWADLVDGREHPNWESAVAAPPTRPL